jgi:hypothetical protein
LPLPGAMTCSANYWATHTFLFTRVLQRAIGTDGEIKCPAEMTAAYHWL